MQRNRLRTAAPPRFERRGPIVSFERLPLLFDTADFVNPSGDRYLWIQGTGILYGPFAANVIAKAPLLGGEFAQAFPSYKGNVGHTEDFTFWTILGAAVITPNVVTAPDTAKLADQLTFAAANPTCGIKIALTSALDNQNQIFQLWARTAAGTKNFRIGHLDKSGALTVKSVTASTSWNRFFREGNIGIGATPPEVRIINDAPGNPGAIYLWGGSNIELHQLDGEYAYQTNETGADLARGGDDIEWTPDKVPHEDMRRGFRFRLYPPNRNQFVNHVFYRFEKDATHWLQVQMKIGAPNRIEVNYQNGGGIITAVQSVAASYSEWSVPSIDVFPYLGRLVLTSFSAGDGTYNGSAFGAFITDDMKLICGRDAFYACLNLENPTDA